MPFILLTSTGSGVSITARRSSVAGSSRDSLANGDGGATSFRGERLATLESVGCRKLDLVTIGCCEKRSFMLLTFTFSGVSMPLIREEAFEGLALRGEMACLVRSGDVNFCCEASVGEAKRPTDPLRVESGFGFHVSRLFPTD